MSFVVYTDAACIPNPGRGSWAYLIIKDNTYYHHDSGLSSVITTNNRMEVLAAIKALEFLPIGTEAEVKSDSKYLVLGASEWMSKWFRYGNTSDKKNADLWYDVYKLCNSHKVIWTHIRGHSGDVGNEWCDEETYRLLGVDPTTVKNLFATRYRPIQRSSC
jgi:ribonuclease HI